MSLSRPAILIRADWAVRSRDITPESTYLSRRLLMAGAAGGAVSGLFAASAHAAPATAPATTGTPGVAATPNPAYTPGRAITDEKAATTYNNYYEVDTDKDIWQGAQKIPQRPWTLTIDGMVANKKSWAIDDLIKAMPIEQRIYRHRCVEGWAMTVPWSGFPLAKLIAAAGPSAGATYVTFTTLADDKTMPGLSNTLFPWPYLEGLSLPEATNPLAFLATGMYDRAMPPQDGGPIRLVVPWKYGFKSAKALVKITLTDKQPMNFWQAIQPSEYGFWANVNPAVPHPRWSQATERLLGSDQIVPTQIYNGYGAQVAGLYTDLLKQNPGRTLFF